MYASFLVSYETSSSLFEYYVLQVYVGVHLVSSYFTRYNGMAGGTVFILSYSHSIISPRTPKKPGWSASGFLQPSRHRAYQVQSGVRGSVNGMNGGLCPINNSFSGGLRHIVCTLLKRDAIFKFVYSSFDVTTCKQQWNTM